MRDGSGTYRERLVARDDGAMSFTYALYESPLPTVTSHPVFHVIFPSPRPIPAICTISTTARGLWSATGTAAP